MVHRKHAPKRSSGIPAPGDKSPPLPQISSVQFLSHPRKNDRQGIDSRRHRRCRGVLNYLGASFIPDPNVKPTEYTRRCKPSCAVNESLTHERYGKMKWTLNPGFINIHGWAF